METGISGKKIVPLLYGGALVMAAILFWYGKREAARTPGRDGVPTVEALDSLRAQPSEWRRITFVEGQGWVVFVPCQSEAGTLRLETSTARPRLVCEFCDTLTGAAILGFAGDGLGGTPKAGKLRFDVDTGSLEIERVDAGIAARFPDAPLHDRLLTWKISPAHALFFVPAAVARDFETLRAEDESPEGCLGN
jgi:hypothetical protein